jgi:hypothetical protein
MAELEMLYIANDGFARKAGCFMEMPEPKAKQAVARYRKLEVAKGRARFLLDYYDDSGDLADTILLDGDGFTIITGNAVKSDAEYCKIDEDYWADVRTAITKDAPDA